MTYTKTILTAAATTLALSFSAAAQEAEFQLPEQCNVETAMGDMDHSAMGHGSMDAETDGGMMDMDGVDLAAMPEHVQENMRRMMISMPAMHDGMMNEDADIAFACGMIAHHQGAIDMAEVLIDHGQDPQMLALAEAIIAAQVAEMEEMSNWLAENAN
ncbi:MULTISPECIES: DUF305 domain-containing protein [unclassified Yoonia]|uniref:DUF305 domain-containing protein n=1 Tax=unclassified Yoonia TaxID=2629118 RepID=UPI002AFDD71F|nr:MULTISPECIES: DUF305 domain-containing protein [unclassified Yoonia]